MRENALGDALRHTWALRRLFRIGRGASRTALPRWSVGTIIGAEMTIVPMLRAGAWQR
ncbi:DUF1534 domain-containing protein [Pseudomonas congelans]|nr:DUF1534 domain-containing protein [Pseudomonas congelans]PBP94651.1 DUF1534 domain-containing protein [Pseudomonas congelans]